MCIRDSYCMAQPEVLPSFFARQEMKSFQFGQRELHLSLELCGLQDSREDREQQVIHGLGVDPNLVLGAVSYTHLNGTFNEWNPSLLAILEDRLAKMLEMGFTVILNAWKYGAGTPVMSEIVLNNRCV